MEKIVLALSGGVDSAVAVHLLQQQGYDVYGYTFVNGRDEAKRKSIIEDAAAVAAHFGIPHEIEDLTEDFEKTVISYFSDSYFQAKTPNPCVFCNRAMKFPKLLAYADRLGIEKVATGHYVQMKEGRICRAEDRKKDQSYVLCLLPEEFYPRFVFPLGAYHKPQIRRIAEELNLPVAHKEDSQEICFIPDDDYKAFLTDRFPEGFRDGDFLDTEGNPLGRHKGLPFYTIGQRRGIGIAFGSPKYVVRLDAENNAVVIGDKEDLMTRTFRVKNANLVDRPEEAFSCTVKIRYLSDPVPAEVRPLGEGRCEVILEEPQKSVTPGQYAVFYRGDILLGGGEIEDPSLSCSSGSERNR